MMTMKDQALFSFCCKISPWCYQMTWLFKQEVNLEKGCWLPVVGVIQNHKTTSKLKNRIRLPIHRVAQVKPLHGQEVPDMEEYLEGHPLTRTNASLTRQWVSHSHCSRDRDLCRGGGHTRQWPQLFSYGASVNEYSKGSGGSS